MMSFERIGKELGIAKGTAHTHYYRGVRKLKRNFPATLELLRQMTQASAARQEGVCTKKPQLQ